MNYVVSTLSNFHLRVQKLFSSVIFITEENKTSFQQNLLFQALKIRSLCCSCIFILQTVSSCCVSQLYIVNYIKRNYLLKVQPVEAGCGGGGGMMDCLCPAPRTLACRVVLLDERELLHEIQVNHIHQLGQLPLKNVLTYIQVRKLLKSVCDLTFNHIV